MMGNEAGPKHLKPLGMLLAALFASDCSGGGGAGASVAADAHHHHPVPIVASPSPTLGSVTLSTSNLSLLGTGAVNSQMFTASQNNYGGAFTVTTPASGQPNSCSGIATVAPLLGAGPFTVTGVGAGTCSFTITGGNGLAATLTVVVTTTSVGGS
jgi:hypothetical protein